MSEIAQSDNFNEYDNYDYDPSADDMMPFEEETVIKVIGVGGAGGNAINRMIDDGLSNVSFVAINTDKKDLFYSKADAKIALVDKNSRGLGAGADPSRGERAAEAHKQEITEIMQGTDMVFITCGEGGGTGTGASPVVARAAKEAGALTIAVVTRPFSFEGPQRAAAASGGIDALRHEVDALIVIPNDRLLELGDRSITIMNAFKAADTALLAGVQGITNLITMENPYIHVDFADVTAILHDSGTALFGIGSEQGEDRAVKAAEKAINSPLLEDSIDGASGVLVNVAGPTDITLDEITNAVQMVQKAAHPEAQIIWGLSVDDSYGDEVTVTVIAAGFDTNKEQAKAVESLQQTAEGKAAAAPATTEPAATKTTPAPAVQQPAPVQQQPTQPEPQPQPVQPVQPAQPQPQSQPVQQPVQPQPVQQPVQPQPTQPTYTPPTYNPYPFGNDQSGDLDLPDFLR